jgi:hypothetical protein
MTLKQLTAKTIDISKKFSRHWDLLILAHEYGIDLEKEYLAMLERLEKRILKGEFK